MNLEELKVVWDSQNDEPVYAFDRKSMLNLVRKENRQIARCVNALEIAMIACAFAMTILLPLDAWREGDGAHQYVIGVICAMTGVYAAMKRLNRRRLEVNFDASIRGVVEKSLAQIRYQQKSLVFYFLSFHLPIATAAGVGLTFYSNMRITWIWGGVLVITLISAWSTWRDIKGKLIPKEQNLEELARKLSE